MPYCQLYFHMVWGTLHRAPLLMPEVEPVIFELMLAKAVGLGARVFAINGTVDHVHMVASIPPSIAIANFIGQVKGVSSARVKHEVTQEQAFFWQADYGAFSFEGRRLPNYIAYVKHQKEHHQHGTTIALLERCEGIPADILCEDDPLYAVESDTWRRELEEWATWEAAGVPAHYQVCEMEGYCR